MLHREGGLLSGVCQESEFMEIHALNPRITTILNPYFSKLCLIVPIECGQIVNIPYNSIYSPNF
jgi:hypothetical protein